MGLINTIQTNSSYRGSSIFTASQRSNDITTDQKLKYFETLGRVSKEDDGKIIKDENDEVITVEKKSYA